MNIIELTIILLLMVVIGGGAYGLLLTCVFKKSREKSFRRGMQARGYSRREIDDAVADLNRRKWK